MSQVPGEINPSSRRCSPPIAATCFSAHDGTFSAAVYDDGKQVVDSDFTMMRVKIGDIRQLYNRVLEKYGKTPTIEKSLDECFPLRFFAPDL